MKDKRTENPPAPLAVGVGAVSETGHREENQDCMTGISSPFGSVYLIADGMGGHRGGAEASRRVVESFGRHLMAIPRSSPAQDALDMAVRLANLDVMELGKSGNPDYAGMGSTVAIALVRNGDSGMELITAHVGDSRIYLHRNSVLTLLTKDHTQVQWLIDNQALDEETARSHPNASVLTRAMGHTTDLHADVSNPLPLLEGDGILICSDGLSGFATAADIAKTIERYPDPTECARQLVQLALASGSDDNITVQFLLVGPTLCGDVPQNAVPGRLMSALHVQKGSSQKRAKIRWWIPVVAACLLLLLSGAEGWRLLHKRERAKALDAEGKQLADRVTGEAREAKSVQKQAEADAQQTEKDLKQIGTDARGKTLLKQFQELTDDFHTLAVDAANLNRAFEDESAVLNAAAKATDSQRQSKLDDARQQIETSAKTRGIRQQKLTELEDRKNNLENNIVKPHAARASTPHATSARKNVTDHAATK